MAPQFIKSIDIEVFPAVQRAVEYSQSKRTTEQNLTTFAKLSSSKENLSQMFKDPDDNFYIIFNIAGYWFRVKADKIPAGNNLHAYIALKANNILGYMLHNTTNQTSGSSLDEGGYFKGLAFDTQSIPNNAGGVIYYSLKVRDGSGNLLFQNLKLSASEVRNKQGDNKSITEEFTTAKANITTLDTGTINGLSITETDGGKLEIADDKTLKANKTITFDGADNTTLTLDKDLNISGGDITVKSNNTAPRTLTLTGSPSLSNITTTGTGTLAFTADKTLTVNDKATVSANTLELSSGKQLVMQYAGLTVGASGKTGNIALQSSDTSLRTLTLAGSVTLAGNQTLTLDKNLTINTGNLTLAGNASDAKTLTINDTTTLNTNNIALGSGKVLTMQHAGLTVGASGKTGTITLQSLNTADRILTLGGNVTLAGTGKIILNKNLTVDENNITLVAKGADRTLTISGANKTIAGSGTTLTLGGNLTTTGAYTTELVQGKNVTLTLPTSDQTLATIEGQEALTNKTINGVELNAEITGFTLKGGSTTLKTLTVNDTTILDTNKITFGSLEFDLPSSSGRLARIEDIETIDGGTI